VPVLALIHQEDAGSGVFGEAVRDRGDELVEWNIASSGPPPRDDYEAVLVFGGAMHVDQEERHPWLRLEDDLLRGLLRARVPLLGVCLGAQLAAKALGAAVAPAARAEVGWYEVELTPEAENDPLFSELPKRFEAFQWHRYAFDLPPGAVPLAQNANCLQAYRAGDVAWGIQFHAEVRAETLADWLESSRPEEDGDLDFEQLEAETKRKIDRWNELGKLLAGRFLDAASAPR
jgi:GMP synthase (glutamine-hydrolysing)